MRLLVLTCLCVLWNRSRGENVIGDLIDGFQGQRGVQSLLTWAIENSDPEKLRQAAESVTLERTRERVKELSRIMSEQVSESGLMKEAISIMNTEGAPQADVLKALSLLANLVERIDNANDLMTLDGIRTVLKFLNSGGGLKAAALRVIAVAASNNPKFQDHLYQTDPEIVSKLLELANSEDLDVINSALHAVSSLVRNSQPLRTLFYANGGLNGLHRILRTSLELGSTGRKIRKKCLALVADLIQLGDVSITDKDFLKLIAESMKDEDWDIFEKAMLALSSVAGQAEGVEALKSVNIDGVLEEKKNRMFDALRENKIGREYSEEVLREIRSLVSNLGEGDNHSEL